MKSVPAGGGGAGRGPWTLRNLENLRTRRGIWVQLKHWSRIQHAPGTQLSRADTTVSETKFLTFRNSETERGKQPLAGRFCTARGCDVDPGPEPVALGPRSATRRL